MSYYNQNQPPVGVPPPQGYPPEGYPKDAYPPQGYPPQGYPQGGYPPQGYPPQYAPQYGQPLPQQQQSSGKTGFMEGCVLSWAKEKFQTQSEAEKPTEEMLNGHQAPEGHTGSFRSLEERSDKGAPVEEIHQFQCPMQIEMQILDEKIRLWSIGKEADIRLLLSSLHHILWPNSGWSLITLANIIESSQVKKAYQKAQLCLHPDKLQQRGSTLSQKHIAKKAFPILQEIINLQYFQEGITTKITKMKLLTFYATDSVFTSLKR